MNASNEKPNVDFMILMEDYQESFTEAYRADPSLSSLPYEECTRRLFSRPIYYGDAYIDTLASYGLRAEQVVPFCRPLQFKWASERSMVNPGEWVTRLPGNSSPVQLARRFLDPWIMSRIVAKQIADRRPKIVWVFSSIPVTARHIKTWRHYADHVILWWSCPLWNGFPYAEFDLVLTAVPSFITHFEKQGVKAAYFPHSFDPRILGRVPSLENRVPRAAFVGSLSRVHGDRVSLLDALSRRVPLDFYGYGAESLPSDSPLRHSYRGPAWGDDLYSVYGSYLIVVHRSADVWKSIASAKRLFEATGMGACVVTEETGDLSDFFEPGVEIVTYSDIDECIEKVEHLLKNPDEARRIGQRGQQRTLRDHTYRHNVRALLQQLEALPMLRPGVS